MRAIIRRKGHPTQSKTFIRKTDAVKWARKIESEIDHGYSFAAKETVADLLLRYKTEVSPGKPGARWEETRLGVLLRHKWTEQPALECVDAVQAWTEQRLKEVSPATVNRDLNLISAVFTHAIKRWRIKLRENPIRLIARPPKTKPRNMRIKAADLSAIWSSQGKPGTIGWYLPIMFELAIETGLRLGEMCKLTWGDVHVDEKWLYVAPSKNGDSRNVPLSQRAMELLAMPPRVVDVVFPVNKGSFDTIYRDTCKKLGLEDLHFHDTRHEAVSRLAKIYPVAALASVIGHRDLKSLLVYYNPTVQELAQYLSDAGQSTLPHP